MGSYGQNDDLDDYEDDFIDDDDGGVGPSKYRYAGDDQQDEDEEEYEEEEEVEEEPVSQEALKLLKYRQKLKEQLRHKLRQENGGGLSKSLDQGRKPPLNNFGSFFGPSQPVIADRVVQESKALLETRHLASKASTSQNNGKKVNMPSTSGVKNGYNMPSTSGARNGVSREPLTNQGKSKVQTMKRARDYSFLLSDDADVPKPQRDNGQPKNLASRPDARPAQLPTQSNRSSGPPSRKIVSTNEQRKAHGTPQAGSARTAPVRKLTSDNRASVPSSNSRREQDPRKPQPQSTKQVGTSSGNGSVRPPLARAVPPRKPLSSTDKKMPMQKKPPPTRVNDRVPPVSKHSVPNGQRLPVEKTRGPSVPRPQDRNASVHHSRDNRVLKKDTVTTLQKQMKPPRPSSLQTNLDRDHSRVQKPHGQLRVQSQSGGVRKDLTNRKRKAGPFDDDDDDDPSDYRSCIRKLFKYNRNKYVDSDDDDKDMEVGFDTILQEESRSARIAKKEDDDALELILEEERQERLRKKAKMRKMNQR
ncbi:hypothetical protein KSS87_000453 [Heliosperma pusillum]|nr:hypothetical protein KSS87_000453 [Heliosperma pusillum]